MKKAIQLFCVLGIVVILNGCKTPLTSKPTTLVELNQHLNVALETTNVSMLLSLLNKEYKNEQLAFLNSDTTQFLNELFCGYGLQKEFNCPGIDEIKMILFSKPDTADQFMSFDITIQLRNGNILIGGILSAKREKGKLTLVGAVG